MPVRHAHDDSSMEEEERAIAGMALYVASTLGPNSSVTMGPGLSGSPTRYIGVVKPIHLYLELEAWCQSQDVAKASFQKPTACIRIVQMHPFPQSRRATC
jgi:hypothetical protein